MPAQEHRAVGPWAKGQPGCVLQAVPPICVNLPTFLCLWEHAVAHPQLELRDPVTMVIAGQDLGSILSLVPPIVTLSMSTTESSG